MSDELPQQWAMVSLADLVDFNPKHSPTTPDSTEVTFVPMAAVSETRPQLDVSQTKAFGAVRKGFTHFADGDVLFAKITPCMENGKGGVAMGLRNGIGCGTTELVVMRPRDALDPLFLYRFLAQPSVRAAAKENFTGTAGQARVPASFLQELAIPVPPLDEQRRIVAKLEKLLGRVDACRQRLAKIPALLKRFRQAVLAAACSGRLTADWREENPAQASEPAEGLPDGWCPSSVGDITESLKYGTATKCGYEKRGVPVLRIPNVVSGKVDHTDLKFAELPAKELNQLRLVSGDILLIRSNGSVSLVGRTAVVREAEKDFAYAGYLIRLRPNRTKVEPDFLNLVLASFDVRLQIELEARSTSGVNNINSEEVQALRLQLPPLPEQQEIVCRVESLFALADRIEARLSSAQRQVDTLTPSLLARAFAGKLVPQDPADEPASAMLERIRAKRKTEDPHLAGRSLVRTTDLRARKRPPKQ